MINDNCRVCKGKTKRRGYLYICKDKSCEAVFWDKAKVKRKIKEDPKNRELVIEEAKIPKVKKGYHFLYVLRMKRNPRDIDKPYQKTEYIGETALHPYIRYLNHITKNNHSRKFRTDRYATALIDFKCQKMTREVAKKREKQLILEKKAMGINALGG